MKLHILLINIPDMNLEIGLRGRGGGGASLGGTRYWAQQPVGTFVGSDPLSAPSES